MTVIPILLLFLLSPVACSDEASTLIEVAAFEETTTQEVPTTTADPCICGDEVFDESEMDGYIKNLEGCKKEYSCNFIVAPKEGHVVSINVQEENSQANAYLYYYKGSKAKEDMIYVSNIARAPRAGETIQIPEGYGAFLTLNGTAETDYYWYSGGEFQARFERYATGETTYSCPQPILAVNSSIQSIKPAEWTRGGCAFRLSSQNSIQLRATCNWMSSVAISTNFANQSTVYKRGAVDGRNTLDWYLPPSALDVYINGNSYYSFEGCTINYFSLDYNPCNCSTTSFNLTLNSPVTLSSPGYPRLLCNNLNCHYNFSVPESAPSGSKVAFVVSALHRSRARGDKLRFDIDKKDSVSLNDHNSNTTEQAVYVGDLLEIDYTASSLLSDDHGFIVNISAVHVPNDCLCPSHLNKELDGNTFSMEIKSHCRIMNCRFTIPNNSSADSKRTFRMDLDHYLPQDGETLDIVAGDILSEHYHDDEYKASNKTKTSVIDYVTNSSISIQYLRVLTSNVSSEESHFNMTWKWMTSTDCNCGHFHEWAEPDGSMSLYSPGYPERYCNNMNCTYHIEAHEGNHVEMNVTFFEAEPHRDFLNFYDGAPDAIGVQVRRLTGFVRKTPVIRTGGNATLVFTSDSSVSNKGFTISYRSVPNPPEKSAASPAIYWIVLCCLVTVMVTVLVSAVVVVYRKRTANRPLESISNPIYGFSNVHDVLVFPNDE